MTRLQPKDAKARSPRPPRSLGRALTCRNKLSDSRQNVDLLVGGWRHVLNFLPLRKSLRSASYTRLRASNGRGC